MSTEPMDDSRSSSRGRRRKDFCQRMRLCVRSYSSTVRKLLPRRRSNTGTRRFLPSAPYAAIPNCPPQSCGSLKSMDRAAMKISAQSIDTATNPDWRWTHGFVENVAAAVALAATHSSAAGRVYNVGEASTPTIAERLAWLPPSAIEPDLSSPFDFTQNIAYDTSRIRTELGYREIVSEEEAVLRTLRVGAR